MYGEALSQDFKAESDCCRWEEGFPQKYLFKAHGAVIHMVGTCDSFLMMLGHLTHKTIVATIKSFHL